MFSRHVVIKFFCSSNMAFFTVCTAATIKKTFENDLIYKAYMKAVKPYDTVKQLILQTVTKFSRMTLVYIIY